MRPFPRISGTRLAGAVLTVMAYPLIAGGPAWAGALGLEGLALAFWLWARASEDAADQLPRWGWLRRPAQALWIAAAARLLMRVGAPTPSMAVTLRLVEAAAIVWSGLELLAALPAARPYSDRPGPLLTMRPWLPVLLPAAGFLVMWRHAGAWTGEPLVRDTAQWLLVVTALLGTLRAFGRLQWTVSLRWLTIADSALAALLVATATVQPAVSLMLWAAACGGRALMLAGELRGAMPRRGALLHRLWRTAAWVSSTALAWPLLLVAQAGRLPGPAPVATMATALPVALAAWITVRRFVEAPERRQVQRADPAITVSHSGAILTLVLGPLALLLAWWTGFEASWPGAVIALVPSLLGGALAGSGRGGRVVAPALTGVEVAGRIARAGAREVFRSVLVVERRVVTLITSLVRGLALPIRDLHTGDPQEALLLVAAVALLSVLLSILR